MRRFLAVTVLCACTMPAWAAMQEKPVEWTIGADRFSGYLVYDDDAEQPLPGLAMVPDWLGVTPEALATARKVAGDEYAVLVVDMYGKGVRPKNGEEALAQVKQLYAAPERLRTRIGKAIDVLKAQAASAPVDATRLGAFGFCMGGTSVLELARAGSHPELKGIVSLHGGLQRRGAAAERIATPLLILNGGADAGEIEQVPALQTELDAAKADWTLVNFGGAEHCFALEGKDSDGCRYHPVAARRAYEMMDDFFEDAFESEQ